jgi:hypothetical protein
VGSHHNLPREAVATIKHSVKIMAEKENNQRHKSTINKYFDRTAKAYKTWCDENEEERNYMQIAAETTGETDENGNKFFDFHIAYSGKPDILASGLLHSMKREEFVRQLIIGAARMYHTENIKMKDNETSN